MAIPEHMNESDVVLTESTASKNVSPPSIKDEKVEEPKIINYLHGRSLAAATGALCLAVFLPGLELTIVATSLVNITDDLLGFDRSSWIITAYLVTYTGFFIVLARFSEVFGRKLLIITSVAIFAAFSAGCGAAQTLTQLIILRAFQGIGASGSYSIAVVMLYELIPPEKYAAFTSIVSGVIALGLLLGPIIGGVINNYTTWRWVFFLK